MISCISLGKILNHLTKQLLFPIKTYHLEILSLYSGQTVTIFASRGSFVLYPNKKYFNVSSENLKGVT